MNQELETVSHLVKSADNLMWLGEPEIDNWFVVIGKNRDSPIIDEVNFDTALDRLGGESETVRVINLGHWLCGWVELVIADPVHVEEIQKIKSDLADYPLLDEEEYSRRQDEAITKFWDECSDEDKEYYYEKVGIEVERDEDGNILLHDEDGRVYDLVSEGF